MRVPCQVSISNGDLIPIVDEFRGDLLDLIAENEV
jgi:hypothetical protein